MEELATTLTHKVHFRLTAPRTRVAVLQFVIVGSSDNLDCPCLLQSGKVSVDGTQRDLGQTLCYFGSLENPIWIFGHEIHDHLSCLRFIFHIQPIICISFANSNIVNLRTIVNFKSRQHQDADLFYIFCKIHS